MFSEIEILRDDDDQAYGAVWHTESAGQYIWEGDLLIGYGYTPLANVVYTFDEQPDFAEVNQRVVFLEKDRLVAGE